MVFTLSLHKSHVSTSQETAQQVYHRVSTSMTSLGWYPYFSPLVNISEAYGMTSNYPSNCDYLMVVILVFICTW
jgi:hypothetical protein